MKFKVGDRVILTKEAQKLFFPKGTEFATGIVQKIYPNLNEIVVKRYLKGTGFIIPYLGHENRVWDPRWWRKL